MTLTNEDIVGSLLPNVYLSRVILQSNKQDQLLANVQFVIKETYGNDDISSWLEDSEVLKHLKIFVIQSADEDLTKLLKKSFDSPRTREIFDNQETFDKFKTTLLNEGRLDDLKKINYKEIKLFELQNSEFTLQLKTSIRELERLGKAEKVVNDDGSESYNIYMDVDFDSGLGENPQHLSYLFGTMYDLTDLLKELEVTETDSISVGEMNIEAVIIDSEVLNTTFIYTDENGEIWTGPIHTIKRQNSTIIRSGQTEGEFSKDLIKVEIENHKVQDFRELRRNIDFLKFNLPESETLNSFEEINLEEQLLAEKDNSSISKGYTSINARRDASISFFVDFKKMFIKNSLYGQVLSKLNTQTSKKLIESYYKLATLESMVLYAKRIDIDDSLTNKKQLEQIVAEFYGSENIENANKPILFPDLQESRSEQLHIFSLVHTRPVEIGTYEYIVELEYKDNVTEKINEFISNLKEEQSLFKEYHGYAVLPNSFNTVTNRFRTNAFTDFTALQTIRNFATSGRTFLDLASTLLELNANKVALVMTRFLSPVQGTPETISFVIRLYDQMIDTLEKSISLTPFANNSLNEKGEGADSQEKVQSVSKTVKIRKVLDATVDFDNDYLIEYLDHTRTDSSGLRSTTGFLYEVLKTDLIAKKLDPSKKLTKTNNANEQNKIVFDKLSQILSDLGDLQITKKLQIENTNLLNNNPIRDLQRAIQPFNPSLIRQTRSSTVSDSFSDDDKKNLNTLMLAILSPSINNTGKEMTMVFDTANTDNFFWKIEPNNAIITKQPSFIGLAKNSSPKINGLFKNHSLTVEQAKALPNQLKSLIKLKIDSASIIVGDAEVRFKYEMLKQIRYISGFSFNNKTETYDLEIPVWKVLDNLTTLENRPNKTLFCKMLNYDNHFIGYKFNNSLNETTINECFFINNSDIDDRGMINSGATQISSKIFEQRCLNEISWFFNGQETPQVGYEVDGKADLMQDSYLKTKYSYLSPYGFQIDEKFRATTIHHSSVFDGIINSGRIPPRRLPIFPTIRFDSKLNIKPPVVVNDDLQVSPKPIVDSRPPVITTQNVSDIAKQRINRINASSLAIYTRNIDRLR